MICVVQPWAATTAGARAFTLWPPAVVVSSTRTCTVHAGAWLALTANCCSCELLCSQCPSSTRASQVQPAAQDTSAQAAALAWARSDRGRKHCLAPLDMLGGLESRKVN